MSMRTRSRSTGKLGSIKNSPSLPPLRERIERTDAEEEGEITKNETPIGVSLRRLAKHVVDVSHQLNNYQGSNDDRVKLSHSFSDAVTDALIIGIGLDQTQRFAQAMDDRVRKIKERIALEKRKSLREHFASKDLAEEG